jgi:segregation and condensation protein A
MTVPEHPGALQTEMPFAIVHGEPLSSPPQDLYIPPDALEVILEAFEGPLDLLLYLIKRQNLEILDISIARVTHQYMEYIEMMQAMRFELAAEYLLMAATLAEIKSRMLLPRPVEVGEEDDPRAELIRRLQEYEQFKKAAEDIDNLPRLERDFYLTHAAMPPLNKQRPQPEVSLKELLLALKEVVQRAEMFSHHHIQREPLSVRERMTRVLDRVTQSEQFVEFTALFKPEEGRMGVVVTFLAILELLKNHLIDLVQAESFAPIYLSAARQAEMGKDEN